MTRASRAIPALLAALASAVAAALVGAAPLAAQDGLREPLPPPVGAESVTVVAGAQYAAGGFHRFLFGGTYRPLWTTPIRVPVLDLGRFAGGLRPTKEGGGQQTQSLRLESPDGREWAFRSVGKDPSAALPKELRAGPAAAVLRDQISASFPGAGALTPPFYDAVGVLHINPRLAVMPDDPRLGEHRAAFAGMLGTIEEFPDDGPDGARGFAGSKKVVDTEELMAELNAEAKGRVDAREFLAARLVDFLLNNWDRHAGQWRWAREKATGPDVWHPVPRDMDQVLFATDGLLPDLGRAAAPKFVALTREPDLRGLTINSRPLDRRMLAPLERATVDSVAQAATTRLTDAVIEAGIGRLPAAWRARIGAELRGLLEARRAALPGLAARWYRELARVVDVHGTDAPDAAEVVREADGAVRVRLAEGAGDGDVYYERRFVPAETREIRIYLHGGDDRAVVRGDAPRSIAVRVIGGNGTNALVDSSRVGGRARPTHLYDVGPTRGVVYPDSAVTDALLDRRPVLPRGTVPFGERGEHRALRPDAGGAFAPRGGAWGATDLGLVVGGGVALTSYGFRRYPYARRVALEGRYATGPGEGALALTADWRPEASPLHWSLRAEASGLELTRFYGAGNATARALPNDAYALEHTVYRLAPTLGLALGERGDLALGPVVELHRTDTTLTTFAARLRPYGSGDFGIAGLRGTLGWDLAPGGRAGVVRPVRLEAGGGWFPALWDADRAWGEAHAVATTAFAFPVPLDPVLALRAGGRKVWGTAPYFALAFLGGHADLRGWDEQRFAGDAAAFGNAELRVRLLTIRALSLRLGALGLADAGRVWLAGETGPAADDWHTAWGTGGFLEVPHAGQLSVTVADGAERTSVYVRGGFSF
ncbi:MAG TPA: hypothetical protein VFS40_13085 [Gemmatimonadales bacterium]|nr:hypothetical protein [Gemmatimonadales bacterium]